MTTESNSTPPKAPIETFAADGGGLDRASCYAHPWNCPICKKRDRIMAAPENYLKCNRCQKSFPRDRKKEKEFVEHNVKLNRRP